MYDPLDNNHPNHGHLSPRQLARPSYHALPLAPGRKNGGLPDQYRHHRVWSSCLLCFARPSGRQPLALAPGLNGHRDYYTGRHPDLGLVILVQGVTTGALLISQA